MQDIWIPFGTIGRAHGLRGEIRLHCNNPGEVLPAAVTELRLQSKAGAEPQVLRIESCRPTKDALLVRLSGVQDRNQAALLSGAKVEVRRDDLPPLDDEEFYFHELIGMEVFDESGRALGKAKGFASGGAQDLVRMHTDGRDWLLPLLSDTVQSVERDLGHVTVRLVAGLLD